LSEDPRLETGARALCAFRGLNPDEPILNDGALIPMWQAHLREVRAVIEAADAVDRATPEMDMAGEAALRAGPGCDQSCSQGLARDGRPTVGPEAVASPSVLPLASSSAPLARHPAGAQRRR
jgi:hypothetical protein